MFLGLALLGTGYLLILGRPAELRGLIDIAGVPPQPSSTGVPVTGPTIMVRTATATDTPALPATPTSEPTSTVTATHPPLNTLTFCVISPSARTIIVRSGPGTRYAPLGEPLPVGTCLAFGAQNEESTWLQIAEQQRERVLQPYEGGWIARELLGLGRTDPIDLPAVTLTPTSQPGILRLVTPTFTATPPVITLHERSVPILFLKPGAAHVASGMSQPGDTEPPDNFLVEAEWPARMEVGGSGTIQVSLIRTSAGYVPTVEIAGNTAVVFTPIPVGTPGQDLSSAFGQDYIAKSAVAQIAGASFTIQPAVPSEAQMLDQPQIVWTWNISSDTPVNDQGLDLTVQIEWQRVGNAQDVKSPVIWRDHIEIDVFQPLLKAGQVSTLSLFSAFLGSGLSIPWLYERLSKRKTQQKRKPKKRS